MFGFDKTKRTLIISNRDYFPILFQWKNKHPELNVKFVDTNEVVDALSISYKKDPISFLIKNNHIEYNKAVKIAKLLQCPFSKKNPKLAAIYDALKDEYISEEINPLVLKEYLDASVVVFENNENDLINNILSSKGIKYTHIGFEDLEFNKTEFYQNPKIYNFKTKFDQYFFLFSNLRKELKSVTTEERNSFKILVDTSDDIFYIDYFSKVFGVPTFAKLSSSLYTNKKVNLLCKEITNSKSFDVSFDDDSPEVQLMKSLIDNYGLDDIASNDFDYAYLNLLEILSSKSVDIRDTAKGLLVSNAYNFNGNEKIYVTNFQYDSFYKEFKDNNVISDKEIAEIGGTPSYKQTLLDKRKKSNYIKYLDIRLLSRVEQHLDDKIYDSQFVKELGKNNVISYNLDKEPIELTSVARNAILAYKLDGLFYNEPFGDVRSYDHSFKGIQYPGDFSSAKSQYSVSAVKSYIECPFAYLMNKILPCLDDERHQLWKGTLIHKVFEKVYTNEYDYEKDFAEGRLAYQNQVIKDGYPFTKKEEIILDVLHHWLKPFANQVHYELENGNFIQNKLFGKDVEFEAKCKLGKYNFHGFIDKILFTQGDTDKYYTIMDYKSGSHSSNIFDPFVALTGYDIQLPVYYKAISEQFGNELANYTFGGFGIKHNFGSGLRNALVDEKKYSTGTIEKKEMLQGLFFNSVDYFSSFGDGNVTTGSEPKIKSKNLSKTLTFGIDEKTGNRTFVAVLNLVGYHFSIEQLLEIIEKRVTDYVTEMINNNFKIAPISTDIKKFDTTKLKCQYCAYRDICYRSIKDANDLRDKMYEGLEEMGNELQ